MEEILLSPMTKAATPAEMSKRTAPSGDGLISSYKCCSYSPFHIVQMTDFFLFHR